MTRMRSLKKKLKSMLEDEDWKARLEEIAPLGLEAVGPLLSFLHFDEKTRGRAAVGLGLIVAAIASGKPEDARNVLRRFMWHMNEESGNVGWGIPEAFAEALARSELMAGEFHRILLSYIHDTGKESNYCDHGPLRRSCYAAVAILAAVRPDLAEKAAPDLILGLADSDRPCRGFAAYALGFLPCREEALRPLRDLADNGGDIDCIIFDGVNARSFSAAELAQNTLAGWNR